MTLFNRLYFEVFSNRHAVTFFEKTVLKEVHILHNLKNATQYNTNRPVIF